jgi:hypothetical protein
MQSKYTKWIYTGSTVCMYQMFSAEETFCSKDVRSSCFELGKECTKDYGHKLNESIASKARRVRNTRTDTRTRILASHSYRAAVSTVLQQFLLVF